MDINIDGALENISNCETLFVHKGKNLTVDEVKIILKYVLKEKYRSISELEDLEVDYLLKNSVFTGHEGKLLKRIMISEGRTIEHLAWLTKKHRNTIEDWFKAEKLGAYRWGLIGKSLGIGVDSILYKKASVVHEGELFKQMIHENTTVQIVSEKMKKNRNTITDWFKREKLGHKRWALIRHHLKVDPESYCKRLFDQSQD